QRVEVPDAVRAVHDRQGRRVVEGQRPALRPRQGLGRQDRGAGGGVDREVSAPAVALPRAGRRLGAPAGSLGLGVTTLWLSAIVLLPLAALVARSFDGGAGAFADAGTSRQAIAALRFTLLVSLVVAAINAGMGTLIAWVLVRDRFPGRRAVHAVIDLAFRPPTVGP